MARKVFVFDDELKASTVSELIYSIDDSGIMSTEEPTILIYFSTNGGTVSSAYMLSNYLLRQVSDGAKIEIIITDAIHSSGLFFMMDLNDGSKKCKGCVNVSFFQYSEAILHEVALTLHSRNDNKHMDTYLTEIADRRTKVLSKFKSFLTRDEISSFKQGGDVVLKTDRLSKIFNAKIIDIL